MKLESEQLMATSDQLGNESIEDLTKEVEQLKQKLEDERAKFHDVERELNLKLLINKKI